MISLPKPAFSVRDVISDFSSEGEQVQSVSGVLAELMEDEAAYDRLAGVGELFRFSSVLGSNHEAFPNLKWAYSNQIVRGGGRQRYNAIRGSAATFFKKCPLCLVGYARPLDHYLPKEHFASLAVTPINLVPICDFCNSKKLAYYAETAEEQPLHPYYDSFASAPWLVARLARTGSPEVLFDIEPPESWTAVETARVRKHFRDLDLQDRYSEAAMQALSGLIQLLHGYFVESGETGVLAELRRQSASERREPLQAWRAAALEAWADSSWFCGVGIDELWRAQQELRLDSSAA